MFVVIIGLCLIAAGFYASKSSYQLARYTNILKFAGVFVVVLGLAAASVRQIDAGTIGVQSLFGKVSPNILDNGLHFVNPLAEVTVFDTKVQNYTMSAVATEGEVKGDDAIRVLSADGLEVVIDLTVLYKILPEKAPSIYKGIGADYKDKIVRPVTRTRIRDNAVYYDAVALYSKRRDEFQNRIYQSIDKDFKSRGLVLEQLLIRNINLPESVKKTIESKINAEQEAQKMEFVLQKEKQEAERKRVEAKGIADYQTIISLSLTDKQLQYENIKAQKELAASPNAKIVIIPAKGNMPLLLSDK